MAQYASNHQSLSSLLGTVVEQLAYESTKATLKSELFRQESIMGT